MCVLKISKWLQCPKSYQPFLPKGTFQYIIYNIAFKMATIDLYSESLLDFTSKVNVYINLSALNFHITA
mgnify:CR=1 FL=1